MNVSAWCRDPSESSLAAAVGVLILRGGFGVIVFLIHGWHKLLGGLAHLNSGAPWMLAEEIAEMGAPYPFAVAFVATLIQLLCALGLVVGWNSRLNAALLAGVLGGAVVQNLSVGRDPQLAALYLLIAVALAFIGGGRFSIDARRVRS